MLEINCPTCAKSLLNLEVLSPSVAVGDVESNWVRKPHAFEPPNLQAEVNDLESTRSPGEPQARFNMEFHINLDNYLRELICAIPVCT